MGRKNGLRRVSRLVGIGLCLGLWWSCGRLAAGEQAEPAATKIAVIFLEKVLGQSAQVANIKKVAEDSNTQMKQMEQRLQGLQEAQLSLEKNIRLGVGNQPEMQDRWLNVKKQEFQVMAEANRLKATSRDQIGRMLAALMVDINRAIEQVALREKIDVVINRKDAELAAVERKKLRDELLDKASGSEGEKKAEAGKPDESLEQELKQQMLNKLENTFVWSNDSMDITDAVTAQLNQDHRDNKFTNWRDMPSQGDQAAGSGSGGGGPGGGGGDTGAVPME